MEIRNTKHLQLKLTFFTAFNEVIIKNRAKDFLSRWMCYRLAKYQFDKHAEHCYN